MPRELPKTLRDLQERVEQVARECGLDMFPTVYEMLDFDEINMVAAYEGFPVRYPHWKWGMEYDRLSKSYEYGMHKIYEMVINTDPCYAYLLESNPMIDQKLVMCHVCGHNDFFKNNMTFQGTNRKMLDTMANHAAKVRRYMDWYGHEAIENFIDAALSIDNLTDLFSPYTFRAPSALEAEAPTLRSPESTKRIQVDKEYLDRYINPEAETLASKSENNNDKDMSGTRDIMGFLMNHAPLRRWQRDILSMLRDEAMYFAPQAMTKIMNEGWASYWHALLMTEHMMDVSEVIDFADRHAGVVQMNPRQLNPYKLGIELFRDIKMRWDTGRFGPEWDRCDSMTERASWNKETGLGTQKIFEVRRVYNDISFVDAFFTQAFCERQGFYAYAYDKKRKRYLVDSRQFQTVKDQLLSQLANAGHPVIRLVDANFENRGELLLSHDFRGVILDEKYAEHTLKNLYIIWQRPVHIVTSNEESPIRLSYDGTTFSSSTFEDI